MHLYSCTDRGSLSIVTHFWVLTEDCQREFGAWIYLANFYKFLGFGATASTSAPFGGNSSGFGSNTSTGGGLFGGNTATSGTSTGFGGFGGGTSNNTGSLFGGGNRPAFGAQQPSSNSGALFGGSNAFGSSNNQTTSAFGAPLSSALGNNNAECQGTGSTPFQAFTEKEGATGNQTNHFQSISFMQPYKNFSFEVSFETFIDRQWLILSLGIKACGLQPGSSVRKWKRPGWSIWNEYGFWWFQRPKHWEWLWQ